jgi:hypothetical protein
MHPTTDRDDQVFYIGKTRYPGTIDFSKGVAFIFFPEGDFPELRICTLDSPDLSNVFEHYKQRRARVSYKRHGNLPIELHQREEKDPEPGMPRRKFYIGKVQFNGVIDCYKGIVFFAFIADQGDEELQISVYDPEKAGRKQTPQPQSFNVRSLRELDSSDEDE